MTVRDLTLRDAEVLSLNRARHRSRLAVADGDPVDRANGRDFGRRATEEELVRDVQKLARKLLLTHVIPKVGRDAHDGVARDPLKNAGADGGRVDHAVAHREQVLAAPLGNEAEGVEHDALDVVVLPRLELRQLRVEVVARGLRQRRRRIRRGPAPARNADVSAVLQRLGTEIGAPLPGNDERLDRYIDWQNAHLLAR